MALYTHGFKDFGCAVEIEKNRNAFETYPLSFHLNDLGDAGKKNIIEEIIDPTSTMCRVFTELWRTPHPISKKMVEIVEVPVVTLEPADTNTTSDSRIVGNPSISCPILNIDYNTRPMSSISSLTLGEVHHISSEPVTPSPVLHYTFISRSPTPS